MWSPSLPSVEPQARLYSSRQRILFMAFFVLPTRPPITTSITEPPPRCSLRALTCVCAPCPSGCWARWGPLPTRSNFLRVASGGFWVGVHAERAPGKEVGAREAAAVTGILRCAPLRLGQLSRNASAFVGLPDPSPPATPTLATPAQRAPFAVSEPRRCTIASHTARRSPAAFARALPRALPPSRRRRRRTRRRSWRRRGGCWVPTRRATARGTSR